MDHGSRVARRRVVAGTAGRQSPSRRSTAATDIQKGIRVLGKVAQGFGQVVERRCAGIGIVVHGDGGGFWLAGSIAHRHGHVAVDASVDTVVVTAAHEAASARSSKDTTRRREQRSRLGAGSLVLGTAAAGVVVSSLLIGTVRRCGQCVEGVGHDAIKGEVHGAVCLVDWLVGWLVVIVVVVVGCKRWLLCCCWD